MLALFVVLAALNLVAFWTSFRHLAEDAERSSRLYGRILAGLNDPRPGAETEALFEVAQRVGELGIPVVVTGPEGSVTAAENLPFEAGLADRRVREYAAELDRRHAPFVQPGIGVVHYGALPVSGRLKVVVALEVATLVLIAGVGTLAYRAVRASGRDQLWVAMARETAHQMGTPLMSVAGWIEHLSGMGPRAREVGEHLMADLDHLQRVASRFERMGRPVQLGPVGLGTLAERVAGYYRRRLPQMAHRIQLDVAAQGPGPAVRGDPVLLEWALEALVRNAVDALSGRGGHIRIEVGVNGRSGCLRVIDDGPGVSREVAGLLFEPGVSTKTGGWGIGLALADRIIGDQHGGSLVLEPSEGGAVFRIELPLERPA